MKSQADASLYPVFIVAVDIGLAVVLFFVAPVLGVLMGGAGVLVTIAVAVCVREHRSIVPQLEVPYDT